ncbi:MAG: FtsW/RodA/SpoVE family cell cycle protein [Patescibacteria group bacterium]
MTSRFKIDFWLLIPALVLVAVSLTVLFAINPVYFRFQLISTGIALLGFLFFSQFRLALFQRLSLPIYIVSLVLLGIVLILGFESRGAARWVELFGVSIQFSEVLKPFLSIAFVTFLLQTRFSDLKTFFLSLLLLFPILLAIDLQPDLGSALMYAGTAFFVLLVRGFPFKWFFFSSLPFLFVSPFLWMRLHDYQKQRIFTFLNPTADPLGTSYNTIQAIIAVGSGTFFGKGLSEGTQSGLRFLPERHTDFIFATLAEGLGFVGGAIVILTLLFLCYRIGKVFTQTNDQFTKLFAASCFAFFLIQGVVNIGMNMGFLPIVGVTLPFVSFGGSSLLANFIFLGMLSSLSVSHRHKEVLEIR